MVAFGGWEMPVEYSGLVAEHRAVRTAAGLFDVSHMGEVTVEGPGALAFLQRVTCNNVAKIVDGQAQYSALPRSDGTPVDDIVLLRRAADRFLVIVNASNIERDLAWLQSQKPEDCSLVDLSDTLALIALQGPQAQAILTPLADRDPGDLRTYRFREGTISGIPVTIARTGYTGEDGFELLVAAERAEELWKVVLDAGTLQGLLPAGLGARDTLRLEARLLLYGNDMDETTTLVEAGLGWIVSLDPVKGDFCGRGVLEAQKRDGVTRKLVGFEMVGRGIARHGYPVHLGDSRVGTVTSGSYAPWLKKSIGLCYLPVAASELGTELAVEIRGHLIGARVVATPFYKRQT